MNRRTGRTLGGFTLMEVTLSTAILSMLVLAGATASKVALTATGDVVRLDAAGGRSSHTLEKMRRLLLSASVGSLQGTPAGVNKVPEPMQPATDYDNVQFRIVTGFANNAPVYQPALGTAPWKLYRSVDGRNRGALWLDDGHTTTKLLDDVESAKFQLAGRHLDATLVTTSSDCAGTATVELQLNLLVP